MFKYGTDYFICNNSAILEIVGKKISKNKQEHYASSKTTQGKTYVRSLGFRIFPVHLCPLLVQPTSLWRLLLTPEHPRNCFRPTFSVCTEAQSLYLTHSVANMEEQSTVFSLLPQWDFCGWLCYSLLSVETIPMWKHRCLVFNNVQHLSNQF